MKSIHRESLLAKCSYVSPSPSPGVLLYESAMEAAVAACRHHVLHHVVHPVGVHPVVQHIPNNVASSACVNKHAD